MPAIDPHRPPAAQVGAELPPQRNSPILWVLVPLILFGLTEAYLRMGGLAADLEEGWFFWYQDAMRIAEREPIDVIFIGSSRVQEAVDAEFFEKYIREQTGRPIRAANLGKGYSTLAIHYLGLRNLFDAHPEHLEGATVFVETPGGLPEVITWRDDWIYSKEPQLIVPLLRLSDLVRFWRLAEESLDYKLNVTTRYLFRFSKAFQRRARIRQTLLDEGKEFMLHTLLRLKIMIEEPVPEGWTYEGWYDQQWTEARMAANQAWFDVAGYLGQQYVDAELADQEQVEDFEDTVLASIIELVRANGGQVVFFETPISSVHGQIYETDVRVHDREAFAAQVQRWRVPYLANRLQVTDEDFPDVWHLHPNLREEYTQGVADAWLEERGLKEDSAADESE